MKNLCEDHQLRSALLGRLLVVLCVFLGWGLLIFGRLVDLQALRSSHYKIQSQQQQEGFIDLIPRRGDILDRNLAEMAISVRADSVGAHPPKITDPELVATQLEPLLQIPKKELLQKLTAKTNFIYLKRQLAGTQAGQINALRLQGISLQEEIKRAYPSGPLGAHLMGIVGTDNKGLEGLEFLFEKELNGEKARVDLRLDAKRQSFSGQFSTARTRGNSLVLTIDRSIQYTAERILQKTVVEKGAANGSIIVMDPHTGALLAMASYPAFDPNSYSEFPAGARRNRAIHEFYEPGSTFKVVTLTALLSEGLADPDEIIDCRPGTARIAGKVYREAKSGFDHLSVAQVIAKSSNVGTVKLALRLGDERLHDYIARLGFGLRAGVDLPGEEAGILRSTSEWSKISIGAISIGQEIGVTPLQMIRAVCATANGGYLVRPFVVQRIVSPEGDPVQETAVQSEKILEQRTVEAVREVLKYVVLEGTGRNAQLRGYSSAGKTGTAQKIVNGRYSHTKYVASYVGFAPADKPALVCLVVINEPKGIPYGGHVAAPAFRELMEKALIQMGVPRDRPVDPLDRDRVPREPVRQDNPARQEVAALMEEPLLAESDLRAEIDSLLVLEPEATGARTGQHIIDVGGARYLPDFSGRSLREVALETGRLGLTLRYSGSGVVISQRPAPGIRISPGLVCEVFLSQMNRHSDAPSPIALRNPPADAVSANLQ